MDDEHTDDDDSQLTENSNNICLFAQHLSMYKIFKATRFNLTHGDWDGMAVAAIASPLSFCFSFASWPLRRWQQQEIDMRTHTRPDTHEHRSAIMRSCCRRQLYTIRIHESVFGVQLAASLICRRHSYEQNHYYFLCVLFRVQAPNERRASKWKHAAV